MRHLMNLSGHDQHFNATLGRGIKPATVWRNHRLHPEMWRKWSIHFLPLIRLVQVAMAAEQAGEDGACFFFQILLGGPRDSREATSDVSPVPSVWRRPQSLFMDGVLFQGSCPRSRCPPQVAFLHLEAAALILLSSPSICLGSSTKLSFASWTDCQSLFVATQSSEQVNFVLRLRSKSRDSCHHLPVDLQFLLMKNTLFTVVEVEVIETNFKLLLIGIFQPISPDCAVPWPCF